MTVRTTGGSPAPPRRRAERFGLPLSAPVEAPASTDPGAAPASSETPAEPPPDASAAAGGASATVEPAPLASQPASRPETRREVREARRHRRRLLAACGAVVAVCLALTILIVSMARQRPSGLPAPTSVVLANPLSSSVFPSLVPGAPAPHGGDR